MAITKVEVPDLPATINPTLSDIIYAVQGYNGIENSGTSVKETLGQIFGLFQTNIVLTFAGNPNGNVAGTLFQFCWDSANNILYVCTTPGIATLAIWKKSIQLTAGTGIAISQSGNNIVISTSAIGLSWTTVTALTQNVLVNSGYVANSAGTINFNLPSTMVEGDEVAIEGLGAGGWTLNANSGQTIQLGTLATSTAGSLTSAAITDNVYVTCIVQNTTWRVRSTNSTGLVII